VDADFDDELHAATPATNSTAPKKHANLFTLKPSIIDPPLLPSEESLLDIRGVCQLYILRTLSTAIALRAGSRLADLRPETIQRLPATRIELCPRLGSL
jgi:hypothetical protein